MMRKFFVALLVGAVVVGLAAPAFAADLKFTGTVRLRGQFDQGLPCLDATPKPAGSTVAECDGNVFDTRFRPRFEVETEGGVRAVLFLEVGDVIFGDRFGARTVTSAPAGAIVGPGSGGGIGADGVNVETKNAYIDFPVPATPLRLRAGIQGYRASKDLVFEDDGAGLSLYGKLGEINANGYWLRARTSRDAVAALDGTLPTSSAFASGRSTRDIYGLDLTLSPMKDLSLNGYFIYDHDGSVTTPPLGTLDGFWIGAAAAGKIQNIRWDLDFVYGTKEISATADQKGWMVDGGVGMALAGTPFDLELRGWYATGEEDGLGDSDALPIVATPDHEPGTQVAAGGGAVDIEELATNAQNTWGLGLIGRWTVSPTLRITGNVFYIGTVEEGTTTFGSPVGDGFLAGVDSVGTEVSVKVDYTLARGLVATFVAGHLFLGDDEGRESITGGGVVRFDDATKVAAVLNYGF